MLEKAIETGYDAPYPVTWLKLNLSLLLEKFTGPDRYIFFILSFDLLNFFYLKNKPYHLNR